VASAMGRKQASKLERGLDLYESPPTIKRISWRKVLADAPNAEGRVPCSF
jgi:hypothetical protein